MFKKIFSSLLTLIFITVLSMEGAVASFDESWWHLPFGQTAIEPNDNVDVKVNNLEVTGGLTGPAVGDVNGPASAVDGNITLFDGTTGKIIKDGLAKISDLLDVLTYDPQGIADDAFDNFNHTGISYGVVDPGTDIITVNVDTTKYDIPPLTYYINGTKYTYPGVTGQSAGFVPGDDFIIIGLNSSGLTTKKNSFFSAAELETIVELGGAATADGSNIVISGDSAFFFDDHINNTYVRHKIFEGTIFGGSAGLISENGITPLQLDVAGGNINDPDVNTEQIISEQNIGIVEAYNVSGSYELQPKVTPYTVNVTQYDNSTDLVTLGNNKWATHTILRSSRTGTYYMVFSTSQYDNEADALEAPIERGPFTDEGNEVEPIAQITVQKNTSSIGDGIQDRRNNVSGIISASTSTLQNTYDRSGASPQITTSPTGGAFGVRQGSGADTDTIIEGVNGAGSTTFSVTGEGGLNVSGDTIIGGDLTVNGTTTTLNTSTLEVEDTNISLGNVTTPTDVTADGGGFTLKGATDKIIQWLNADDRWHFNQGIEIDTGNLIVDNNIGVGTTTPQTPLDVNGAIRSSSGSGQTNIGIAAGIPYIQGFDSVTSGNNQLALYSGATEKVRIDNNGNVGIGTSSPTNPLTISTTVQDSVLIGSSAATVLQKLRSSTTANDPAIGVTGDDFQIFTGVGPTERVRIDSNGNVGIGTIPSFPLHVKSGASSGVYESITTGGNIGGLGSSNRSRFGGVYLNNPIAGSAIEFAHQGVNGQKGAIAFMTKGTDDDTNQPTEVMVIENSGNVGIGTSSISSTGSRTALAINSSLSDGGELQIQSGGITRGRLLTDSSGVLSFFNMTNAQPFVFGVSGAEAARFDGSGNFGIGTSSPSAKLDVVGNTELNGDLAYTGNLSHSMGEIYWNDNATATSISTANTYTKVAGTSVLSVNTNFDNDGGTSNRLRYTGATTRMFHVAVSVSFTTANNSQEIAFRVVKNGTTQLNAGTAVRKTGTGTDIGSTALHVVAELATNDYIELFTENRTGTSDPTVVEMNMVAMNAN